MSTGRRTCLWIIPSAVCCTFLAALLVESVTPIAADAGQDVLSLIGEHYRKLPKWMQKLGKANNLGTVRVGAEMNCVLADSGPLGPAIIGGIGDSGTRGIAGLVEQAFHYNMCPYEHKCNKAMDNVVMFKLLGAKILEHTGGTIDYSMDHFKGSIKDAIFHHLCLGINHTLVSHLEHDTLERVQETTKQSHWGWKSPRSIYYLPFYHEVLKGKFRFIHVLRDGRDVATGDNQMQHRSLCRFVEAEDGEETLCGHGGVDVDPAARLEFWAKMNVQAYNYGSRVLGPDRYFLLRIEDVALDPNPLPTVKRLARFLDKDCPTCFSTEKALEICSGHSRSYGGNKLSVENRSKIMSKMHIGETSKHSVAVTEALELFGYKTTDWGVARSAPVVGA